MLGIYVYIYIYINFLFGMAYLQLQKLAVILKESGSLPGFFSVATNLPPEKFHQPGQGVRQACAPGESSLGAFGFVVPKS